MLKLPRVRAAAVEASPVYLNAGATATRRLHWSVKPQRMDDIVDLRVNRRPLAPLGPRKPE